MSFNLTATEATAGGHIRVYPAGTPKPATSSLNFAAGQKRGSIGIVSLGATGDLAFFSAQASGTVHVILDVNGYFERGKSHRPSSRGRVRECWPFGLDRRSIKGMGATGAVMRSMKTQTSLALSILSLLASQAGAQSVLFDFNTTPYHTPLPIDLTEGGITASFSGTGASYSIQLANISGIGTPAGFSGNCLYPNSSSPSDLLVSFSQALRDASIMFAPSELGCDSTARMRITGYMSGAFVATSTATAPVPGTWPTGVLTLSAPQGFDSVVIHYDAFPSCETAGPIFVADNLTVTPRPPPPAMVFHTLAPCRLLDTRKSSGPDAAYPALGAHAERPFALHGRCGIPLTAKALSVNMTAAAATVAGNLVIYPGNESAPGASLLNFPATAARGNNAIVNLAPDGTVNVMNRANGTVEFILDVNGYFE